MTRINPAQAIWPFKAGRCDQIPAGACSPTCLTTDCKSGPMPPQTDIKGKLDTVRKALADGILRSASIARADVKTAEPMQPAKNRRVTQPGRVVAKPIERQEASVPVSPSIAIVFRPLLSVAYPQKTLQVLPKKYAHSRRLRM